MKNIKNLFTIETIQKDYCREINAKYKPSASNLLSVIIDEIYLKNLPLVGVRYKNEDSEHMSGWWIIPKNLVGKENELKMIPVHTSHIYENRPDIIKYLGLDVGYRFDTSSGESHFDAEALD